MFTNKTSSDPLPYHLDSLLDEMGVVRIKNSPVVRPKEKKTYDIVKVILDENGEPPF
jgi:hypothetical protein